MRNKYTLYSPQTLTALAPVLFLLMWSSGAVMAKVGLQYASVWSFLIARSAISLLLILVLSGLFRGWRFIRLPTLDRPTKRNVLGAGLLVQAGYLSGYFLALQHGLSPGIVTVILGLQPLLTPLLTRQKQSGLAVLCLMGGFFGLCLAVAGSSSGAELNWTGLLCAILALLAITWGTIFQSRITLDTMDSMLYQNSLALLVFSLIQFFQPWHMVWNPELIASLLWMSVIVSTGAVLLLMLMLKQRSASQVSVLFYAIPALAMLFDFIWFDTRLSLLSLSGVALVAVSVWRYTRHQTRLQQASATRQPCQTELVTGPGHHKG